MAVVTDEAEVTKLVHEKANPRSGRANHFSEQLLAYLRYDWLWLSLFAKVGHQEQHSRQTLLARIEELVDQVLFNRAFRVNKYVMNISANSGSS